MNGLAPWRLAVAAACVLPAATLRAESEGGQYWALLADGKELTGRSIRDWTHRERRASLEGRPLFDAKNPVVVLCHSLRRPGRIAGPHVVLANGDVLPGRVTAFLPADPGANQPARLAVEVGAPLGAGVERRGEQRGRSSGRTAYIRAEFVAAVVFTDGPARPGRGGAIRLADGTAWAVSSLRWVADGVRGLAPDRVVSAGFAELAEVHLPGVDRTGALLADAKLAEACEDSRLVRLETVEGAVLTYAEKMRISRSDRYRGRQDVLHAVQPAWALTPIAVPEGSVAMRTWRGAAEVPVSLLPAETLAQRSFTGFVWPWRRNRNVRGELLQCGPLYCGLGFGTHSYSEVAFALPPGARTFTCRVGLDRAVGAGGCVRCAVYRDAPGGKALWRSEVLVGSVRPVAVGPLDVRGARRLVFVTEFAHRRRPAGADPGDIRDEVDWIMPLVSVEPSILRPDAADLVRLFPVLRGWTVRQLGATRVSMVALPGEPWVASMDISKPGLVLERKVAVTPASGLLEVAAARGNNEAGHVVSVLIDGEPAKGLFRSGRAVHTGSYAQGKPSWQRWVLMGHVGREITVTVRADPEPGRKDTRNLLWSSLALLPVVRGLPADGRAVRPDVPLGEAELVSATWFPQNKGKRPEKTTPPEPSMEDVYGLAVPGSLHIRQGMRLTYRLEGRYRRFCAVVHSGSPWHRGPMVVQVDGKEIWRSDEDFARKFWPIQVVVEIPRGAKTLSLIPEHNMTDAVWGRAGFLLR